MSSDPFDRVLELEDDFFKQGYDAGIADGKYAGIVEGKIFGVEKGYEKALELGRMQGRALTWQSRSQQSEQAASMDDAFNAVKPLLSVASACPVPKNSRLVKHIDNLLSATDSTTIRKDNSDESVTDFEDRLARAHAKAKVIAAILGETLKVKSSSQPGEGIEETSGLNARH